MEICRQMAMLLHVAEKTDVAVVVLNQVRGNSLRKSGNDSIPVASQVVDPWCKVSLRLERIGGPRRRKAVLEKHYCQRVGLSANFSQDNLGAS
jgi:hypothetical protein